MKTRLQAVCHRYGWRTPFVVLALSAERLSRVRGRWFTARLRLLTQGSKGRNWIFGKNVVVSSGSFLTLGNDGYIGDRCHFNILVASDARVIIGDDVWISPDCHIVSQNRIYIGSHVMIGEFVSIRDSTHSHVRLDTPMKSQEDVMGSIVIEDDVWVGRGVMIQGNPEGVIIGQGAIIGANSFVSHSVPPFAIVGGTPARLIRYRSPQQVVDTTEDHTEEISFASA